MLKLDMAAIRKIAGTAKRITDLEQMKDGLGDTCALAIDLPGSAADPMGQSLTVSSAPVRAQINTMIADNHRILADMGVEFVG